VKTLPQNEWDFSAERIDKRELPWCFRYEYARSSDTFLERTVPWRKEHKGATLHFAAAIRALRRFGEAGLAGDFGTLAQFCAVFFQLQPLLGDAKALAELLQDSQMKPLAQVFESGFLKALPHLTRMYEAIFGERAKGANLLNAACQMDYDAFMLLDGRFPKQAYLDSDRGFRRMKFFLLNQFFEPELDSKLDADSRLAVGARAFCGPARPQAQSESRRGRVHIGIEMRGKFAFEDFAAGVNWAHSNDVIIAQFREWLTEHRPHPHYDRARGTNERDMLRALGALRLCRAMGWHEAQRYTKEVLGCPLYSGDKSWRRAAARAEAQLRESLVLFTGLLALRAK
jgi:hypothetical protein